MVVVSVFLVTAPRVVKAEGREVAVLEKTGVHSGPGVDFFKIQNASRGEVFDLVEERKGWVKVTLPDDTAGWLTKEAVEVTTVDGEEEITRDDSGIIEAEVSAKRATLYAGPRDTFVVVKRVRRGTKLQVIGRDKAGDWLKVRLDGPPSWVRAGEIEMSAPISRVVEASQTRDSRRSDPDTLDLSGSFDTGGRGGDDDMAFPDGFDTLERTATPDLATGLITKAGVGFATLSHQLKTDAGDAYNYSVQAFAFDGEVTYWAKPHLGGRFRLHLDWAPKRLKADRKTFKIDPVDAPPAEPIALTASVFAVDGVAVARTQVLQVGAWVEGRVGWRYWSYNVDLIQTNPDVEDPDKLVPHPAFNPVTFTGPVLGGGFEFPFSTWVGLHGGVDVIPFALVSDPFESGGLDTRSGDVDGTYGLAARGGFWLTPFESADYNLDINVLFHWERFFTDYVAPKNKPAPRSAHRFVDDYTSAQSEEGVFGAVVSVVLRK